jgi:hypothetical protein
MAVNYLTGNESPTAAKMNELWAEADSIIDKALKGGSTYLLENIGASSTPSSYPDSILYKGTPFVWTTGGTHTAASTSLLYSAFDTVPTSHSQSSYDTASAAATVNTYSSDGYAHLAGSSTPNLINSLKVHTRTDSGTEYEIWEYDQPAPEKEWKFGTCEIVLASGTGTAFTVPDDYLKYNLWRIHNLTDRTYTIYLDDYSSPTDTFTIPPYGQRCVRRKGTNSYDYSYKYFFKAEPGDPRFLAFDSFDGSIAQTMRANNLTNASYIYNLFEFVGMDNAPRVFTDSVQGHEHYQQRIYFNATTTNDIGSEYATAGHFPTISDTTLVGDVIYHKGKIGYRKKDTSGSTLEVGTIDFDGWASFNTNLAAIDAGLAVSGITNNDDTKIATSATPYELNLWPVGTNVLQINDVNQELNLASTTYNLQTHFLKPPDHGITPMRFNRYFYELETHSTGTLGNPINSTSERYNGKTYTVGDLKTFLDSYQANSTPENKSVKLTSEGPYLFWRDVFPIKATVSGDSEGWFDGFNTNHAFSLELVGGVPKLKIDQEWFIPLRLYAASYAGSSPKGVANYFYGYTCGWPSHWKDSLFNVAQGNSLGRHHVDTHKFHRLHEGPRKSRRYETATPITGGTETFLHNDITGDPIGQNGADVTLANTGTMTNSDIAFLTNDIDLKASKGSFAGGEVNNPNYPRTIIGDAVLEMENSKSASSLDTTKAVAGYSRLNLLKEHFNNITISIKKADKIRPLCIDEIYFGNRKMKPGAGWFAGNLAPVNLYEGFVDGDAQFDFYTDLLGASKILDYTDFADGTAIRAAANTTGVTSERDDLDDFRWVKISDVQDFATAEGLGFRFEEVAAPVTWTTSLAQSYYNGTITVADCFLAATSGVTSNSYKAGWIQLAGLGVNGMVVGENYGTNFDYIQLTDSTSETLGQTLYDQAGMNYLYPAVNLKPIFKNNLGTSANADGYPTGLVIQCFDTTRTTTPRAKLAIEPLKTVRLDAPGTSLHAGTDIAPTDSSALDDITADTSYFFPSGSRHRYAFLLNVTAPETHSA